MISGLVSSLVEPSRRPIVALVQVIVLTIGGVIFLGYGIPRVLDITYTSLNKGQPVAHWSAHYAEHPDGTGDVIVKTGKFYSGEEQRVPAKIGIAQPSLWSLVYFGFTFFHEDTYYLVTGTAKITQTE